MKNSGLKIFGLGLAALLVLCTASWGRAMGQQGMGGQQQTPPPTQGQTTTPPAQAPPAVNPEEEAAFKKVAKVDTNDANAVASRANDFLKKYPTSKYAAQIYAQLAGAEMQLGDSGKALDAGRKSLELSSNTNVDALAVMAVILSRTFDGSKPTAAADLQAIETYARAGIQGLNSLVKPADADDATFNKSKSQKLALCYSGLGLAYLDEGKNAEAVQAFSEATKLESPQEPVDLYLLGIASMQTKQFTQAVTAFGDCIKEVGMMPSSPANDDISGRCKDRLNDAKKGAASQVTAPKQ